MRTLPYCILSAALAFGIGTASAQDRTELASAVMMNAQGERLGTVALKPSPHGVLVRTDLARIEPGAHAFHIHEKGSCEAPDFKSAGGHYNPAGKQHGFLDPDGMHAGDLPNVFVGTDGALSTEIFARQVTLDKDAQNTLFDSDGSALVVHAGLDDYKTDPAGDAGDRIACGVIKEGPAQQQ